MCRYFSSLIVCAVFGIVFCGVFHEGCREAIFYSTIEGMLVGVAHAGLHVYCIHEATDRILSLSRLRIIILHDVRMDTAIGLLIGAVKATLIICGP